MQELIETDATQQLKIPKLRQGSFFPVLLERRGRINQAPPGISKSRRQPDL
jgi:transposase-like protein